MGPQEDTRMEQYEARRLPHDDKLGTHETRLDAHEATHALQEATIGLMHTKRGPHEEIGWQK